MPHYWAIVQYVYQSRYATADQVRRRFPALLVSQRTAQYQLASLVELGLLATTPVRSTAPNFPFVYFATSGGLKLVRGAYAHMGQSWQAAPTEQQRSRGQGLDSLLHELLLTEFELAVAKTIESRGDIELLLTERRYFRRERELRYYDQGRLHRALPDAGFLVRMMAAEGSGEQPPPLLLHLVELDNGTMPVRRILGKYLQYERWSRSDEGRQYLADLYGRCGRPPARPNFRLLMIAHDKSQPGGDRRRMIDLLSQTLELTSEMRDRIWLTTAEQLSQHEEDTPPLAAPIWVRARDLRPWISAYRTYIEQQPQSQVKLRAVQRFLIERVLPALPCHTLFPRPDGARFARSVKRSGSPEDAQPVATAGATSQTQRAGHSP